MRNSPGKAKMTPAPIPTPNSIATHSSPCTRSKVMTREYILDNESIQYALVALVDLTIFLLTLIPTLLFNLEAFPIVVGILTTMISLIALLRIAGDASHKTADYSDYVSTRLSWLKGNADDLVEHCPTESDRLVQLAIVQPQYESVERWIERYFAHQDKEKAHSVHLDGRKYRNRRRTACTYLKHVLQRRVETLVEQASAIKERPITPQRFESFRTMYKEYKEIDAAYKRFFEKGWDEIAGPRFLNWTKKERVCTWDAMADMVENLAVSDRPDAYRAGRKVILNDLYKRSLGRFKDMEQLRMEMVYAGKASQISEEFCT